MQDLLKIYSSLLNKPKQGLKLIERIARLQHLGVAETKAVLDICRWKEGDFKVLMEVIKQFELYETKDICEKTKSTVHASDAKMQRGEVLTMTNKLLIKVSRMNSEYFVRISDSIKEGKISLKTATEEFEKDKERVKVIILVEAVAKIEMKVLVEKHPGCFTTEILDAFLGSRGN